MTNYFFRLFVFVITASAFFFSCTSISKFVSRANMDPSTVPHDFNPKKHILLVAEINRLNKPSERNNNVTDKLDKALKEYCPYKYEIVSLKDIYENKNKYGDTSVYKYAVLNSLSISWHTTTTTTTRTDNTGTRSTSVSPSARTAVIDFGFYDRTNGKRYPDSGNPTSRLNYTVAAFIAGIKKTKG